MRVFGSLTWAAIFAVTMTVLMNWNTTSGQPKEPPQSDPPKTPEKKSESKTDPLDEEILRRANLKADGPALIAFFQKRTLPEKDRPEFERLVRRLGSSVYLERERASRTLIERGVASVEMLRAGLVASPTLELTRRIEYVIKHIQESDVPAEVPAAAVRVLAEQKADKLNETLLGYIPFADNDVVVDEIRLALTKHALKDGKADPVLVAALTDRAPLRRATAAEALGRAAFEGHKDAIKKLLTDADADVRFRVARALVFAKQRDAMPVLIDTIAAVPPDAAWQVEDFLLQVASQSNPPTIPLGNDAASRGKCRDAWRAWWKNNEAKIDLAKLEETPKMLGRTLLVLLDQGRVLELGPDNMPRFEIKNVVFPLDAQILDEERVLVAEYHANRVAEYNTRGMVVWQRAVGTPLVAQRLANGNTFVATPFALMEFDKNNQEVLNVTLSTDQQYIMKAMKLPNGEIACMLADARIVRFSAAGKELHSFPIPLGMRLFGGRVHMLPNGRVVVPHNAEGKVVEYDAKGKVVWEVEFEQPIAATRLPNGNTMITSMNPQIGAVEVNRAGRHLWSYQHASNTRVTRAIKR